MKLRVVNSPFCPRDGENMVSRQCFLVGLRGLTQSKNWSGGYSVHTPTPTKKVSWEARKNSSKMRLALRRHPYLCYKDIECPGQLLQCNMICQSEKSNLKASKPRRLIRANAGAAWTRCVRPVPRTCRYQRCFLSYSKLFF